MHIRYNETLLKYEYTNTDVDTGPWTTLPLINNISGGGGGNVAFLDQNNVFTGWLQAIQSATSTVAELRLNEMTQAVNNRMIRIMNYQSALQIWMASDDSAAVHTLKYGRNGLFEISGGLYVGTNIHNTGGYVYPGRADSGGGLQGSWYLGSHGSYGLYTNTGLYVQSNVWTANSVYAAAYFYALGRVNQEYEGGWSLWAVTPAYFWGDGGGVSASSIDYCYFFVGRTCFINITVTLSLAAACNYLYTYLPVTSARRCNGMGVCLPGTSRIPFHAYSTSNQLVWQRATIHPYDLNHWPAGVWLFALQMAVQF